MWKAGESNTFNYMIFLENFLSLFLKESINLTQMLDFKEKVESETC